MKKAHIKDFSMLPNVKFNRSKFNMNHGVKTTMNVGTLYPIECVEVLPGDTFKTNLNVVSRVTSSFLKPVMDNLYMDIYHFFVPLRLTYDKAEKVFGNSAPSSYEEAGLETIPHTSSSMTCYSGSIADYLGIPIGIVPKGLSLLPFRGFAKIYNDWFRNENITDEVYINLGETSVGSESLNNVPWSPSNYMGMPPKVGKRKDYFTSALPNTQKGASVSAPLGEIVQVGDSLNFKFHAFETDKFDQTASLAVKQGAYGVSDLLAGGVYLDNTTAYGIVDDNLRYDSGLGLTGASINDLRFAFQLQRMLEADARYGGRYNEYLLGHYGVTSPDSRLQFSEFLGGGRIPLNVQQVAQTSAPTEDSPLGALAGYSLSAGKSRYNKGFVEHGYVYTVACIRQIHSYQQGISKMFSRTERNHFYDPLFAHLGEQPIYKSELYAQVGNELRDKNHILGYNEAWAEYRFMPNSITGGMRTASNTDLDIWHFADNYENAPSLTDEFILETPVNVDRTLSVPSTSIPNFICDFWFNTEAIRVMPVYSEPGLIDHRY